MTIPSADDPNQRPRVSIRLPMTLLAIMTIAVLGGPLIFGLVLAGGQSPRWPPDRPVEWWTLAAVGIGGAGLMITTIVVSYIAKSKLTSMSMRSQTSSRLGSRTDPQA